MHVVARLCLMKRFSSMYTCISMIGSLYAQANKHIHTNKRKKYVRGDARTCMHTKDTYDYTPVYLNLSFIHSLTHSPPHKHRCPSAHSPHSRAHSLCCLIRDGRVFVAPGLWWGPAEPPGVGGAGIPCLAGSAVFRPSMNSAFSWPR